ncbi:high-affinity nickel-transport protein [Scopulibacillus darangshiensis]|uniref:Nickel/cobalt efflux system n=1 Tax=Scopulibacillus darangshiensis TaxID=442528 RepID=A0A4V2SNE6_9BACL|nr:HoxN/HupN/NixA family nickel/cobalt transporter [Scopulibacillus darangshiensis]TCP30836.1 high-affinity nickel-transport protein [Scopulibacillus darangshiensis]
MSKRLQEKKSWIPYVFIVAMLHVIGILFLILSARHHSLLYGIGFVAYTLGLRHAFDADHIAAIDNTVRKLVQQERNPTGVGFYFSLGHSSVVFIMAVILAFSVQWAETNMPQMQEIGGFIGMIVSGCFLIIIGLMNLAVLLGLFKVFLRMRHGAYDKDEVEHLLMSRGFVSRLIGPLFKFVSKSWHVYPLGFLFGLGFDTASEVALLAVSAGAAKDHVPFLGILALPILFAAGMSMMDTADGIFMKSAYNWAFSTPLRKVYYNLTVTVISVAAALLIGVVELMQVMSSKLHLHNPVWGWINSLNLSWLGYILVLLLLLTWGTSFIIWKFFRIERRWQQTLHRD